MSCKIQVDSGIAKTTGGSDTRTTMESGGGCVNWMYAEPQTDSVIALRGYGYANIEYNYEGILLGLQLRTTMESGGGCVNWMYAEPQTDSVIALRGYGYANIEYNYEGILLGLQLK